MVGIFVERGQVEVGIRREEVENTFLLLAVPVFPADVPAFDEEGIKAVLGGKVDVAAHIVVVGGMTAVGRGLGVISPTHLNRREVVGVGPAVFVRNHLPPNAHVFHGMNPRHILDGTRLVEVEDKA